MQFTTTHDYLRAFAPELMAETSRRFEPLAKPGDPAPAALKTLLRRPLPAQELTITGLVRQLHRSRYCNLIGEMGTGKTMMAMSIAHAHAEGRPYSVLAQVPPQLTKKWAREVLKTIPRARVFFIEGIRNNPSSSTPTGVNEVKLNAAGKIRYSGGRMLLSDLRSMTPGEWQKLHPYPCYFVYSKDRCKLSYATRPAYGVRRFGGRDHYHELAVNPDSGQVVHVMQDDVEVALDYSSALDDDQLRADRWAPKGETPASKGKNRFTALWQADAGKALRMSPIEFIGRYMRRWFTYGFADEMHELSNETAQGQAFSWILAGSKYGIGMTGTLMGGYASDLFNLMYRSTPAPLVKEGFEWGEHGKKEFQEIYGVVETITQVRESTETNVYSRNEKKRSVIVKKRPGCSPLVFAKYLLACSAFVSLEDIADDLPEYVEEVFSVPLEGEHAAAYADLEKTLADALRAAPREARAELRSKMLHTLMLYPNFPFELKPVTYKAFDKSQGWQVVEVVNPISLAPTTAIGPECRLLNEVQMELSRNRRCQIYVEYTNEHDVRARLAAVLEKHGIRVAILPSSVATDKREEWYASRLAEGVQVVICHPRLVATGLDLLAFPTMIFYQMPYSLHTLRQASRRSWRIGQKNKVRVLFFCAKETVQTKCVTLMGKKMLCALAMEGKFSGEGLEAEDTDGDLFTSLAKELLSQEGVKESVNEVWSMLRREREALLTTTGEHAHASAEEVPGPEALVPTLDFGATAAQLDNLIVLPVNPPRTKTKKEAENVEQLSLFAA